MEFDDTPRGYDDESLEIVSLRARISGQNKTSDLHRKSEAVLRKRAGGTTRTLS